MTEPEKRLWAKLRSRQLEDFKFRRQHGIGPYIVDFYCPAKSAVIEIDVDTHAEDDQIIKDIERDSFFESLGLRVFRYTNEEVMKNLEGVIEDINEKIGSTSPNPSLQRRGK